MSIGKLSEFNIRSGNWTMYIERAEMFFTVNTVKRELWLPTLIAAMGDESYELLSNLTSPKKPSEEKYDRIVKVMRDHLEPKPSFMTERFRFRQRRQKTDETVMQYVSELKRLAKFCEFEAVLEENIRDQLVCGLKSEAIRQRLFSEEGLTYSKAVKISCAMEGAERDAAAVERRPQDEGGNSEGMALNAVAAARRTTTTSSARRPRAGGSRPPMRESDSKGTSCHACGSPNHRRENCRYGNFICGKCKRRGHLRRVCPSRFSDKSYDHVVAHVRAEECDQNQHHPSASSEEDELEGGRMCGDLHQLSLNSYKPVSLLVSVDGVPLSMEIDTGSLVSCISKETYDKLFHNKIIDKSNLVFKCYDGSKIFPLGVVNTIVRYGAVSKPLELFVVKNGTTSLLGRQWLSELGIQIPMFYNKMSLGNDNKKENDIKLSTLLDRYKELFTGGLGRFKGGKASLQLRPGAEPVFCRARPLPYALRERVDAELDGMLRDGVIEPVDCADWATPLVPVRKADGGLRICADYKVTLNPSLKVDRFPLPRINDLLVKLNGAKVFSKIDLSQAYNQIELDDPENLTVVNTHRGLFKYKRLVFGLSSSPGIFQRIMTNLFNDIPEVEIFLDDIIIGSKNLTEHLLVLERVLHRLYSSGMKLKGSKCSFVLSEVKYLGYIISSEGIKVDPEKIEGIVNIPRPTNTTELRAFLGTLNFYAKFVKNLSFILAPLYILLRKGAVWEWKPECEKAFKHIKSLLVSAEVLAHYDPNKPLFLTCDASARGIGGVLSQLSDVPSAEHGGVRAERPVVYVSRALTPAETHYSQIEREALAIVFCFEKLHQYLYGRQFTLRTDHKPLVTIFGPKQGIPTMAASRLQRWAIRLSAYTYEIEYIRSKLNSADGLSRLPATSGGDQIKACIPEQTFLHFAQNALLLDYNEVKRQTSRDPVLSRILSYIRSDWPTNNEIKGLQPYFNRKNELYEELGCVLWGHRVCPR